MKRVYKIIEYYSQLFNLHVLLSRGGGNIVVAMDEKIEVFDTTPNIVQVLFHRENSEDNNKVIIKSNKKSCKEVLLVSDADTGIRAPGTFFQGKH